jgi:hypothetical protein
MNRTRVPDDSQMASMSPFQRRLVGICLKRMEFTKYQFSKLCDEIEKLREASTGNRTWAEVNKEIQNLLKQANELKQRITNNRNVDLNDPMAMLRWIYGDITNDLRNTGIEVAEGIQCLHEVTDQLQQKLEDINPKANEHNICSCKDIIEFLETIDSQDFQTFYNKLRRKAIKSYIILPFAIASLGLMPVFVVIMQKLCTIEPIFELSWGLIFALASVAIIIASTNFCHNATSDRDDFMSLLKNPDQTEADQEQESLLNSFSLMSDANRDDQSRSELLAANGYDQNI